MVFLSLEKKPGSPLIRQMYEQLRRMILNGELQAGVKIPSTRKMALHLNVSRNTVNEAYEMLIAEGYLNGRPGKGIFVAQGAALNSKIPERIADQRFTAFTTQMLAEDAICFHSGTPALDLFPRAQWNKLACRTFREAPDSALGYDDPQGRPELRETLAVYLNRTRGVLCHPDQIIVTTGAKQALSLVARCLLAPGREALIEDPANLNVRKIFSYHTQAVLPIPADQEGIRTGLLPANRRPAVVFATPSHQFPLGGILSVQRRLELIAYAAKTGYYLIEDDYDSEFRYRGLPVSSMQGLDPQKVIYIGTFSKILFPSLRLGYLVLPAPLVEQFTEWKMLGDHHTNSLNQLTLTRFIENGGLERHIARMKKIYRRRRDLLIRCLHDCFADRVNLTGEGAGMHLVAEFPGAVFAPEIMNSLARKGVIASTVATHAMNESDHCDSLILGYAHLSPDRIEEGILRLKAVINAARTFA